MADAGTTRRGGQVLVDQLAIHGVDLVFTVPGESFLPVLDALGDARDRIRLTVCRHEANAANMADAHGKLTGRPGVCLVTRGPGAMHAAIGLHTAFQDSTPLILFVGQVPRGHRGREAFQELDLTRTFGDAAKWIAQIDDPRRIPEMVSRAFHTALSGRPGPVVLGLPEDVLDEHCAVADAPPFRVVRHSPAPEDITELRALLETASRPLVVVGGGAWTARTAQLVEAFARANDLPVAATFRRQDHVDNHSPQFVGTLGLAIDPALARRVRESDLIIAIGARLGDATTGGYELLESPVPAQRLVHVHPDPEELGRVFAATLPINADPAGFALALEAMEPVAPARWADWRRAAREDYVARLRHDPVPHGVDLGEVMATLREQLPADAIIANGAGNYTVWVHRFWQFSAVRSQLAPTSGAMGYGVPAAIAAKLVHPERTVVAFAGDGCFLMSGQELATAVRYELDILFIVVNNDMYGTIRMHQERRSGGRGYGTDLTNPYFAAYARSFGAHGELVTDTAGFAPALQRAREADGPALIELRTDPAQLTPGMRLGDSA